jgi:hypothetical protein
VLLVARFRGGQRQQDFTLLAGASTGQVPVHGGFGPLVGQVLTPTPKISRGRCRPVGLAGSLRVHQPMMGQHARSTGIRRARPFGRMVSCELWLS